LNVLFVSTLALGRPRSAWEDNTSMDIREIRWEGMDWIHVAEDMDQEDNISMNIR
jgi:hypothetical protein